MPPPPASLTTISYKYENCQKLQFTTEFAKTQTTVNKALRETQTLRPRWGSKVRTPSARPPARPPVANTQTHRQDRLQYTAPQLASGVRVTTRKNKHCAILPSSCRQCQSRAKHSRIWAQAMPFCPSNKVTFDLLTLKVVSESPMCQF